MQSWKQNTQIEVVIQQEASSDKLQHLIVQGRRRQWHPTPVLLPGKSHGRRSLVGCSPWGHQELDTTKRLHFDLSLSCIGEGNGNPLQYSCLENPRDSGAWWAAICGVAQSRTWLKWLSSSSIVQGSAYLLNNQSPTRNVTLVGWQQSAPMGWLPWASWLLSMISVSLHLQFLWSGNFGRKEANAGWLGQQVMTEDCLHCCGPRQTGISALPLIC